MAEEPDTITVAGVTFNADQVKSAVLEIDGREIRIEERDEGRQMGFSSSERDRPNA